MRKKIVVFLAALIATVGLTSITAAAEGESKYVEQSSYNTVLKDCEVHAYTTKGAGDISATGYTFFPQLTGVQTYTANPKEGWIFNGWKYSLQFNDNELGNRQGPAGNYTFSTINDKKTAYVRGTTGIQLNRIFSTGETLINKLYYYIWADYNPTITASAGEGGSISDPGQVEVEYGTKKDYTIIPATGYRVKDVVVNGQSQGKISSYSFPAVTEPMTIKVTFEQIPTYIVTYTDGVDDEEVFADQITIEYEDADTPVFSGSTTRKGYIFTGWDPEVEKKVTEDATYVATWAEDKNGNGIDDAQEPKYTVTYTDGVEGEEVFADQKTEVLSGLATPEFNGTPTRKGYTFKGWNPKVELTVTDNAVYAAVWEKDTVIDKEDGNNGNADNTSTKGTTTKNSNDKTNTSKTVQTGDNSNVGIWAILMMLCAAVVVTLTVRKKVR